MNPEDDQRLIKAVRQSLGHLVVSNYACLLMLGMIVGSLIAR